MPTYEYLCPEGHHFEVFQRISEEPGADCPQCGRPAKRQISAGAGFLFKGEGFGTPTDERHCVNSLSIRFRPHDA